jgi:hypothetical protein
MPGSGFMDDNLIKRLIATIKCGTCGLNYHENHVEIIEHDEDIWFLRVFCSSCRVKSLVAAVIKKETRLGATSDLSGAEIAKFQYLDAVVGDDVLDMRRFLRDFNGDFAKLFRHK